MTKDPSLKNLVDYLAYGDRSGPAIRWADTALTVNLTGLNDDQNMLVSARAALDIWTATTGITFTEVTSGADIDVDNEASGAFASYTATGDGRLLHAAVNVADDWMNGFPADMRWGVGDYGLQTFIHEFGHALGLNHPGPYNGDGDYAEDAIFAKDNWKWSVMSYFGQRSDGSQIDYFISSPGVADVAAIAKLYGRPDIRSGDDVYTLKDLFELKGEGTFTLVDSGGADTIDLSKSAKIGAAIDMQGGGFSTLGDKPNDFAIALGTEIENAIGSKFTDRFSGNDADNRLNGGGFNDYLLGGAGDDTLIGGGGHFTSDWKFGDNLVGGSGADLFVFAKSEHIDADRILDFRSGVDIISLKKVDADASVPGNQAFEYIGTAQFTQAAGELRYEIHRDVTLLFGNLDGDGVADFRMELLGEIPLNAADFVL